ncbi:HAD family hydrolase [Luteococcus sp. Sow4_B9]|uniref:HAD family hydrolase n=1 Tax=Luteococcus sp. Sow4_B9 TaxID=3438792 RepID=UPI003F96D329
MPLLLLDLDNTLVDRAVAYRAWAVDFLAQRGADPLLVDEMVRADGDGLRPKPEAALDLQQVLGLDDEETATITQVLRKGVLDHLSVEPDVLAALDRASQAGWTPFIVTNGVVPQQDLKITNLGLDRHVAGWVVSDVVGVRKPDPRIFHIAAEQAGQSLDGAWMVGDAHDTDIEGAQAAGLRSIWMRRGRPWPQSQPEPTVMVDSFPEAVESVLTWRD